jgi:hypothetical protein
LRQLQRWFAEQTTHPEGVLPGRAPLERALPLERLVTAGPQLSAVERLGIYNDGYFARLVECLTDDYPALAYALGEATFTALARDYVERRPSRSFSLNAFGGGFAEFCRERPESWAAFAADLAGLEWALVEVVHEPASGGFAVETLASLPPERLQAGRLRPSRALRVLCCEHAVNDFYQAFRDDLAPPLPGPQPTAVAVYRSGLALWRMRLERRAARLLLALLTGSSLADAIAELERHDPEPSALEELARLLPQWLGAWVQAGFFVGIDEGPLHAG